MALEGRATALEALAQGRGAVVWQRLIADTETPVSAALKLIEPGRGDFLLESVEGGEVRGRYSLIGLDPDLVFRADRAMPREINRDWRRDRTAFAPARGDCPRRHCARSWPNAASRCPTGLPTALALPRRLSSPMRRSALSRRFRARRRRRTRPARHAVRAPDR